MYKRGEMENGQETASLPVTLPSGRTFLESPRTDRISAQLQELVVEEYSKTGNLDASCRKLGVIPRTFRWLMNQDRELMGAIVEARERISDKAEGHIVEHMGNRGNVIDRLAWLRAWRPGVWNPDKRVQLDVNVTQVTQAIDKAGAYEAELSTRLNNSLQCKDLLTNPSDPEKITPPPSPLP